MSNILRYVNSSQFNYIPTQKVLRSDLQYVSFQKIQIQVRTIKCKLMSFLLKLIILKMTFIFYLKP